MTTKTIIGKFYTFLCRYLKPKIKITLSITSLSILARVENPHTLGFKLN